MKNLSENLFEAMGRIFAPQHIENDISRTGTVISKMVDLKDECPGCNQLHSVRDMVWRRYREPYGKRQNKGAYFCADCANDPNLQPIFNAANSIILEHYGEQ